MNRAVLALVFVCSLQACSSPSKEPVGAGGSSVGGVASGGASAAGTGGDADIGGASDAGTGGKAPACNEVAEDAATYSLDWDTGEAPTAKGGPITDGSYVLTRQTGYSKTALPAVEIGRTRIEISGSTWQEADGIQPYDVNPARHSTSTISVQDTSLTLTRTCPSAAEPETAEYSADDKTLTLFVLDRGTTFETVFVRE
jgi:hypothetical protein